jgi:recombinational DNA repair protein (RecF pathway)
MRHKYETRAIVLSRSPVGEASAFVVLLTPELGLVRALAQSVRKPQAKLSSALVTLAESEVVLVRGKDGWRLAGAVLEENWLARLKRPHAREVVARVSGLLLRLVAGEAQEVELFPVMKGFLEALATLPEDEDESIEALAALRILAALGLDAGEIPGEPSDFSLLVLADINQGRAGYVARINRGIEASGL